MPTFIYKKDILRVYTYLNLGVGWLGLDGGSDALGG